MVKYTITMERNGMAVKEQKEGNKKIDERVTDNQRN